MNLFSFIKGHVSIVTVVNEYATLKKAGLYLKGPCPFHSEKTPSFTVSPHKEIFYCFGCHEGGDVIAFVAKAEHCSPLEAAKHLIDRYNLSVPETILESTTTAPAKKRYYELCTLIAAWCHEQLFKSSQALAYVKQRGIDVKSIKNYQLGYFPGGLVAIKNLIAAMGKHNILADDLVDIQILSRGKQVLFSPFEERIMFPIADHLGRFCGFGGRVFKMGDMRPKYYNSHENEFFSKGQILFGLHLAKREVQTHQKVIVVEGYTDCIAVFEQGYPYVVATLGTACTPDHLKVLARYAQQVYLIYDADKAGIQAILRIAELCWQVNLDLWVVTLPAGEDPASFVAKGQQLGASIEQAQDIFSFFIANLGSDFSHKSLADKVGAARKIIELIARLEDPLKQEFLLQQASTTLGLGVDALKKEIYYLQRAQEGMVAPRVTLPHPKPAEATASDPAMLEKKIFYSIINNIDLLASHNEDFLCTYLPEPYKAVIDTLRREKASNPSLTFAQLFPLLDESSQQLVSRIVLEYQEVITNEVFDQLIVQLQKKHWKVIVNAIKLKLEHARLQGNEQEVQTVIQEFLALQKKVLDKKINE